MKEMIFCQSCGMPLQHPQDHGTERDGSPSPDYCIHCYQNGAFVADCTKEEMVEFCLKVTPPGVWDDDPDVARQEMLTWFSTLKRWKEA